MTSFNLNIQSGLYESIDSNQSRVRAGIKYFIAGSGRCAGGQCGSETFRFFLQILDINTHQVLALFEKQQTLNSSGGAFDGLVTFDEVVSIHDPRVEFQVFMWDLQNNAMSEVFFSFQDLEGEPTIQNIFFGLHFSNGNTSNQIVTQSDFTIINAIQGDFTIELFGDTIESPTKTLQQVLDIIDSNKEIPDPDPIPQSNWVSQSVGVFNLENDRLTGEILFIAQSAFDPFFYGVDLINFLQVKDPNGQVLLIKENFVNFTETERDERIFFDEGAFGNIELTIESFVWDSKQQRFTDVKTFTIKETDPPMPPNPDPTDPKNKLGMIIKAAPLALISLLFLNSARKGGK